MKKSIIAAAFALLFGAQGGQLVVQRAGAVGCRGEKSFVALVGCVVALDKVADVHVVRPVTRREALPFFT